MPVTINGTTGISGVDGSASTPAVQGTDTNTGIAFPAADTVTVATGGSERMRVDSSGNVGIGTSSPSTAANGGLTLGTTSAGKSLIINSSSSGNNGLIRFIDSNGSNSAELVGGTSQISIYGYGSRQMTFWTNGTERLTIPSDSAGIKFPATQAASTDANTLDDYEEGTWTPTLFGASTAGTTTYTVQEGAYVKIGRQVTLTCFVSISAMTGTGALRWGGVPFAVGGSTRAATTGMVAELNWGGGTFISPYLAASDTTGQFYYSADDVDWGQQNCVNESMSFIFSITYFT